MTGEHMIIALLACLFVAAQPRAEEVMPDIQRSHIEANVPDSADFEKFLQRDLESYFAKARKKSVAVKYEPLRNGPTQSGVGYPKLYLWVQVAGSKSPQDRGAIRLEAIDKKAI
jgi:hypothetical protein